MPYTVVYLPSARSELARIWLQATDRRAVTVASHRIDRLLRLSPLGAGVPQGADYRLVVDPLDVVYGVSAPDRMVTVARVAYVP